jgi:hypothetical protein
MATTIERAKAWLSRVPHSISGQNGHAQAFTAATGLIHGFCLDDNDAYDLLSDWNRSCQPPWKERELVHKIRSARDTPHSNPRGHLLESSGPRTPPPPMSAVRFTKQAAAPAPLAPIADEFHAFLQAAFCEGEIVCICNDLTPEGKPNSSGSFMTREQWMERFAGHECPLEALGSSGAFVRINPFAPGDFSGSDKSVSNLRHVLVEMDEMPKAQQLEILQQSGLPISVLIDSGGKSIHAWVRVDAIDRAQWEERRDVIYAHIPGIDPKNKNPSRYSRLPGAQRGDHRQRLIATRIGSPTWEDWIVSIEQAEDDATVITTEDLAGFDPSNDPDNLVGNRWLTKGSSIVLSGGSGIGKSSLIMQLIMLWATGKPFFGIAPVKPLRIGVIQAENDKGDLAEAFQGVVKGLSLSGPDSQAIRKNISFRTETVRTGQAFLEYARRFITKSKLDLIVCDPLLSYFGGDLSNQEAVSKFLRNQLQPILKETKVCWMWIHHIAKPAKDRDGEPPSMMELAYSGFGSSELTNWAREIAVIQEVGHQKPRKFRLNFCKRGGRLDRAVLPLSHGENGSIVWSEWNPGMMTGADLKKAPARRR